MTPMFSTTKSHGLTTKGEQELAILCRPLSIWPIWLIFHIILQGLHNIQFVLLLVLHENKMAPFRSVNIIPMHDPDCNSSLEKHYYECT